MAASEPVASGRGVTGHSDHGRDTYVPLWCKSYYSFLEGASSPDELVAAAAGYGLPGISLSDRDGWCWWCRY
ncbi:MAG: hypothetical protein LC641_11755 [Spirochaeta sp.]|nr:hypothetical protein [Spirochaeta sp.]